MPKLEQTNITDSIARSAKPRDKRYDIFDARLRGMGLRVAPSGTKSWIVMRRANGRMVRKTIGRYPELSLADARIAAAQVLAELARGEVSERRDTLTAGAAVAEWLQKDQSNNRTVRQVRNAFELYVLPAFANRKLKDITKGEILHIIDAIVDRGAGVQANRVLSFLRRFFNWCIERDYLASNPTAGISKPHAERPRERVLSPSELSAIKMTSDSIGYPFGYLLQLLLLTGQRRDEVAEATWSEINLEERQWTIPGSRAKNGRPHVVHLSAQAVTVLTAIPRVDGQDLLFSTNGKRPVSGFSAAKKRIDRLSGVTGWTLHDLRRSFATHATEKLGISPVVVDKILNHQSGAVKGVAAVYQRGAYLDQRREAIDTWASWVTEEDERHRIISSNGVSDDAHEQQTAAE
ncbi:tyrosine-type recombinase/integrase [Leisingera sp. JC11]|uniref:tyrosine-type recombinase/integrase n=1 Tax=Leisingera sp. JC11 TaxID=3042469 RepID=UPI0034563BA8